jgi:hypothetical protein
MLNYYQEVDGRGFGSILNDLRDVFAASERRRFVVDILSTKVRKKREN